LDEGALFPLDSGSFLMRRGFKSLGMLFYLFRKMVVN